MRRRSTLSQAGPADVQARRRLAALGATALLCLLALPLRAVTAQTSATQPEPAVLVVKGSAELRRPADRANLAIAVVTEHAEAGTALERNNEAMRRVVSALVAVGLEEREYETGRFSLRPTYSRRPRQPAEDWKPQITGYEVTNSLTVRTTRLDRVGAIVEAANRAGANSVNVVGFDLADPQKYRLEAIREATRQARSEAAALAAAADVSLVRILRIALDASEPKPAEMAFTMAARSAESAGGPPIVAGDVTLSAIVHISYEIRGLAPASTGASTPQLPPPAAPAPGRPE